MVHNFYSIRMPAKRLFDIIFSLVGLAVLSPLLVVLMLLIRMTSTGPALFRQTRVGRNEELFVIYKLRSMYANTVQVPTYQISSTAVTPIGRYLRRSKLDELPQLINVLKGEMSLVGPRPSLTTQKDLIEARRRTGAFKVLPGITGLSQIKGIEMSEIEQLAKWDGEYAKYQNFSDDFRILMKTLCKIFF